MPMTFFRAVPRDRRLVYEWSTNSSIARHGKPPNRRPWCRVWPPAPPFPRRPPAPRTPHLRASSALRFRFMDSEISERPPLLHSQISRFSYRDLRMGEAPPRGGTSPLQARHRCPMSSLSGRYRGAPAPVLVAPARVAACLLCHVNAGKHADRNCPLLRLLAPGVRVVLAHCRRHFGVSGRVFAHRQRNHRNAPAHHRDDC